MRTEAQSQTRNRSAARRGGEADVDPWTRLEATRVSPVALGRGAFVVSIDVEMAWGTWDKLTEENLSFARSRELPIMHALTSAFAEHGVPATWAVVGRIFDPVPGDEATRRGGIDCWRAPQMIDLIEAAPAQEIGSHSQRHRYFGSLPEGDARAELDEAAAAHARRRVPFVSWVFPRNEIGHLDLLREAGIRVFRSRDEGLLRFAERHASRLRPAINLADKLLPVPPPVVSPFVHRNGLVELPSSMLLMARSGVRKLAHPEVTMTKVRMGLDRAAKQKKIFHLWFHPSNFYFDEARQLELLGRILAEARDRQRRGEIDLRTMASFARA